MSGETGFERSKRAAAIMGVATSVALAAGCSGGSAHLARLVPAKPHTIPPATASPIVSVVCIRAGTYFGAIANKFTEVKDPATLQRAAATALQAATRSTQLADQAVGAGDTEVAASLDAVALDLRAIGDGAEALRPDAVQNAVQDLDKDIKVLESACRIRPRGVATEPPQSEDTASPTPAAAPDVIPASRTRVGCPAEAVAAQTVSLGLRVQILKADQFDYDVCVITRGGQRISPVPYSGQRHVSAFLATFPTGGYFAVDSLNHIFVNLAPGQISGVLVVIPNSAGATILGPIPGAQIAGVAGAPFTLQVGVNDCMPTCAGGATTYKTYHWDTTAAEYVAG